MKLKRIIWWGLFAIVAYNLFGYAKVHTRGEVIAYKRFAEALLADDPYDARQVVVNRDYLDRIFAGQADRKKLLGENTVLFTYCRVQRLSYSDDGETAYILADQVNRVNPPDVSTLIGDFEIRIRHSVELKKEGNDWRITQFLDPAMK